jgi:hypothetical protein
MRSLKGDLSKHDRACKKLRKGLRVIVDHYVPDHDGGWYNAWTDDMREHIGKTIFVVRSWGSDGVRFEGNSCGWPAHALKKYVPEVVSRQTVKVKII